MNAAEQLKAGQLLLTSRGVTPKRSRQAAWDTYLDSKLDRTTAEIVAAAEAAIWSTTPQPHTEEAVARHIC